jgi:hypothetical protein
MKKNKTIWIAGFILLFAGLAGYRVHRASQAQDPGQPGAARSSSEAGLATASRPSHANIKPRNPMKAFIAAYQTPIEFYGKVVDQHGDPVAAAEIKIMPFDNAFGSSDTQMLLSSDADGRFSVKGLKGLAMGVQVEKTGYLTLSDLGFERPASARRIEYGLDGTGGARFKDSNKPTLFTLHKIGPLEPMAYVEQKRWSLPVDGSPRHIALDSKEGKGTHQIEFRFTSGWSQIPSGKRYGKLYDWKLEARIPGGGFCMCPSDYAFDAPESGYQETLSIDFPAKLDKQWKSFAFRRRFVKFADGTHARIRFCIDGNTDRTPLSMTSWMNLKPGSRNLASDRKDGFGMPEE